MNSRSTRIDQCADLTFSGLVPDQPATVSVTTTQFGTSWVSLGTYVADGHGAIDANKMPSIAGTYVGRSAMGLFWSQRCTTGVAVPSTASEPLVSTVHVRQRGEVVEVAQVRRLAADPEVCQRPAADGLVGTAYLPERPGRIPVLVLGGSEGGQNDLAASLMASHGHPTLALTYFGAPGLPPRLEGVPLEYVLAASDHLMNLTNERRFAIYGVSKGGELALVLASIHPGVSGVAAMVPSHPGVSALHTDAPPWTGRGAPAGIPMGHVDRPHQAELLAPSTAFTSATRRAANVSVPTLLVTTGDDTVLPPCGLKQVVPNAQLEHVHVRGAGHLIQPPHLPSTATIAQYDGGWLLLGGGPARNAAANRTAWTKTLRFLRQLES